MKKFYYGIWQNFYNVGWPIRFLIEIIILIFLAGILLKLLCFICKKLKVKIYLIKVIAWVVLELVFLFGHDSEWAVDSEKKVQTWGNELIQDKQRKRSYLFKVGIGLALVCIYIGAVFVDLPFARQLQGEYLMELSNMKNFFQRYEQAVSYGYEAYPPLFVKQEVKEKPIKDVPDEDVPQKDENPIPVNIQLNEKGMNGANIRKTPSLDGRVIGGVNGTTEILYHNAWDNDGERYWIKVYLPEQQIEGWLSGKLVDGEQLEMIIAKDN